MSGMAADANTPTRCEELTGARLPGTIADGARQRWSRAFVTGITIVAVHPHNVRQAMMTRRNVVVAILSIVAISCTTGRRHDSEGNSYAAKVMSDGRTWTTENLRLALPGSYCHGDATSGCLRVGRLYTWATAVEACRRLGASWRLPIDDEWRQLAKAYGGALGDSDGRAAFTALLAGGPSGFNAVLGGNREPGGSYARLDEHGFYWTATESDTEHALFYNFGRGGGLLNRHQGGDKSMAVSVRCVGTR
jgi:uncharacterized protein (TIGR02145 family)